MVEVQCISVSQLRAFELSFHEGDRASLAYLDFRFVCGPPMNSDPRRAALAIPSSTLPHPFEEIRHFDKGKVEVVQLYPSEQPT